MDEVIALEHAFWLQGEDFFARTLAEDAVMVFPEPTGVLTGSNIVASLRDVPRWSDVRIDVLVQVDHGGFAMLAYRVRAQRDVDPPYHAFCSSVYTATGDAWKLSLHQQTPLG